MCNNQFEGVGRIRNPTKSFIKIPKTYRKGQPNEGMQGKYTNGLRRRRMAVLMGSVRCI